jgi:hypothetical protein
LQLFTVKAIKIYSQRIAANPHLSARLLFFTTSKKFNLLANSDFLLDPLQHKPGARPDDGMQAAAEIVSVHGAADGLAFSPAHGPTSGSTARAPGLATLDPPGLGPAQRPADRRKRVSECGAPPIVARAVRPRIAKPVALAPSTALRALAAHVRSTATTPEDIFVQSAAVCLEGNACDRDTRVASAAC